MNKLNRYFNELTPKRQRQILIGFVIAFALLLLWSLGYNQINIKPGYAPKYIGRTTDSLTLKNRSWKNNVNFCW